MKTAVIYSRVSTEDQRENGTSLESQVAACQKYAAQNDYRVLEVFKESKSGASLNRPMLDKVRELVRAGAVEVVIFYALDRLSRDETDTLILAREFRGHGVELKCATTPLEDTPQGQFLLTMLAAVGKLERAGILERCMRGKRQTARNGKVMRTHTAIYGYTFSDGQYQICEEEAAWVRNVFAWYCIEGLPLRAIAERLYTAGVPTKNGGFWAASTVRNILTQEAYIGEYWWGKEGKSGAHRTKHPRSEWIGPIAVPPIIERDMFGAAQQRVQYNKTNSTRNCSTDYLLRGLIICPLCGRRFRGEKVTKKSGTNTYYKCTKQSQSVPGEICLAARVNGRRAEEKAWGWVVAHLSDTRLMEKLILAAGDTDRAQRERDESELRNLLKVRADLDREENKLVELFTADAITLDKFLERKSARDEQIKGVEAAMSEIEARQAARTQAVEDVKSAQRLIQQIEETHIGLALLEDKLSFEDKRALLDVLHVTATATDDGDIRITGFISDEVLALIGMLEGENEILNKERSNVLNSIHAFLPVAGKSRGVRIPFEVQLALTA